MCSDTNNEYSVNWKNHMNHVRVAFQTLFTSTELTDVTLCCEGKKIKAHKMLLSACSTYFRKTFKDVPCEHPVIVLYGVEYSVLSDLLHFIYNGEVSVDTSKLDIFLKTAQLLEISGLTDDGKAEPSGKLETQNETQSHRSAHSVKHNKSSTEPEQTTFAESLNNDQMRRGTKRVYGGTTYNFHKNLKRQQNNSTETFIADVKSEPDEFASFESSLLDDPLQDLQGTDSNDYFNAASSQHVPEEVEVFKDMPAPSKSARSLNKVKCSFSENDFCNPNPSDSLQDNPAHARNTRCPVCNVELNYCCLPTLVKLFDNL